jgi:aminomethyltransferase
MPCGLGARDALRTEAGYPLYGHEIDLEVSPVEAGLMWAVDLDKGEFTGRTAIAEAKRRGPARRLMGLIMEGRAIPRQGYAVQRSGEHAGHVTSGAYSATRGVALGMAYIESTHAKAGGAVDVVIRGVPHGAALVRKNQLLVRPGQQATQSEGG